MSEDSDKSLLRLEDYTLIYLGKTCSARGGLIIYLKDNLKYKLLNMSLTSNIWEGQFIEIYEDNLYAKTLILGNIYKPPRDINENYRQFISEFTTVLAKLEINHSDVIIAGDCNMDLLKLHEKPIFGEYFDAITGHSFFPPNYAPYQILGHEWYPHIDNFLYKISHRLLKTTAGIILSRIADHLPYFVSLDYVNIKLKNVTKFIQVKQQSASDLTNFKAEIARTNLITNFDMSIDADPNVNYDILEHTITSAINKHLPTKTIKFNKHKHKKSNWITKGIIKSIKYRDMLYRQLKKMYSYCQQHEIMVINLRTYNKILKNSIRKAKNSYYHFRFEK